MKSMLSIFAVLLGLTAFGLARLGAQAFPEIAPKDAASMALGGSFVSLSSGYSSFYGNPAGFASDRGEFTISDLKTWAYLKPTSSNLAAASSLLGGGGDLGQTISTLNGLLTQNGLGGGASFGLGYSGKGLGIGIYTVSDEVASGATAFGATVQSSTIVNGVIGLGAPLRIGGLRFDIGGDARPYYRIDSVPGGWSLLDLVGNSNLMSQSVYAGFNLAMDFGVSLKLNTLRFGLAVRDISPTFLMGSYSIGGLLQDLGTGGIPTPGPGAISAYTYPFISLGMAWKPKLLPRLVDPAVYFEVQDPVTIAENKDSVWNLFHLGAEFKLFDFLSLRGGINRGWLSAGFGLDVFVLTVDASVFTEELGRHPGDDPRSGLALQVAIRL